jgi:hypothetical protein
MSWSVRQSSSCRPRFGSSWAALLGAAWLLSGGCGEGGTPALTQSELMDPQACKACHPQQFADWEGSMHAYAAEDPVFVAMNQRGQRLSSTLGTFCVKCHAPVAVALGLTTDGLNLKELPAQTRGVTCYFCHAAEAVDGTHNNPLRLATDGTLGGPFADPASGAPHRSRYSALFDYTLAESAAACGTCHDITNQHDVPVERTYQEWGHTLFSDPALGQTCVRCHMDTSTGPASTSSPGKLRQLRGHAFPAVDVALTPFPDTANQRLRVQDELDGTLQGTLCLTDANRIEVTLDNAGAGHFWPSGATQDRRAWVEVTAYAGDRVVYQSGFVPPGSTLDAINDPDLWLIRDCIYDDQNRSIHDFWNAATVAPSNQIPGPVQLSIQDPTTVSRAHVRYLYPVQAPLLERPDRITLKVFLKAVGDDVLADFVASQDLSATDAAAVPTFQLRGGAALEWTPAAAHAPTDIQTRQQVIGLTCVGNQVKQYRIMNTVAVSRATCGPPS